MTQLQTIHKLLRTGQPITSRAAFYEYGISRLASVICRLREAGVPVHSTWIWVSNRDKKKVRVKRYYMKRK